MLGNLSNIKIFNFFNIEFDDQYIITRVPLRYNQYGSFKNLLGTSVNQNLSDNCNFLLDAIEYIESKYENIQFVIIGAEIFINKINLKKGLSTDDIDDDLIKLVNDIELTIYHDHSFSKRNNIFYALEFISTYDGIILKK